MLWYDCCLTAVAVAALVFVPPFAVSLQHVFYPRPRLSYTTHHPLPPSPSTPAASRFDALCAEASSAPLPADLVVQADVQFVANSPDFFLFEETIRAVVLAMLR